MIILFLTPHYHSSLLGGVERHVSEVKEELKKKRHEIHELSLSDAEGPGLAMLRGLALKSDAWKRLWRQRHLIERVDLVHVHDIFWWYLPFRFLYSTKPTFTTFHGWEGVCPPTTSAILQKKLAQRLSAGTIGIGMFFKKWYGVTPTLTTFGALEPEARKLGKSAQLPEKIKRIAFFGRLEPINGIDIALPVLTRLQRIKYQIRCIGDGSWRPQAERVRRVTGMVKNPWRYILESDLVITSSYLSMLETAALARPIISISTNPLKRDYLFSHPLAPFMTSVSSSEELFRVVQRFDVSKHRNEIRTAQSWALKQTSRKLADSYEKLWKSASL